MVAADMGGAEEPVMKNNSSITGAHGVDVLVVLGADYPRTLNRASRSRRR